MGNCIQAQRATNTASEPKDLSHDNGAESVMIEIPIQDGAVSSHSQMSEISVIKPQTSSFKEPSSKEDMFYDSNLSVDSDFEDYYSANGDTTPSLDDTTIHKSREGETAQGEKSISIDDTAESQPSSNKLLVEFLEHDSLNSDANQIPIHNPDQQADPSIGNHPPKSSNIASYVSIANLVRRGKKDQNNARSNSENARRPAKSCIPNLVQSLSFSQKKKALSTA